MPGPERRKSLKLGLISPTSTLPKARVKAHGNAQPEDPQKHLAKRPLVFFGAKNKCFLMINNHFCSPNHMFDLVMSFLNVSPSPITTMVPGFYPPKSDGFLAPSVFGDESLKTSGFLHIFPQFWGSNLWF